MFKFAPTAFRTIATEGMHFKNYLIMVFTMRITEIFQVVWEQQIKKFLTLK